MTRRVASTRPVAIRSDGRSEVGVQPGRGVAVGPGNHRSDSRTRPRSTSTGSRIAGHQDHDAAGPDDLQGEIEIASSAHRLDHRVRPWTPGQIAHPVVEVAPTQHEHVVGAQIPGQPGLLRVLDGDPGLPHVGCLGRGQAALADGSAAQDRHPIPPGRACLTHRPATHCQGLDQALLQSSGPGGSRKRAEAWRVVNSEKPPCVSATPIAVPDSDCSGRPDSSGSARSGREHSMATRSPGSTPVTPSPSSTTTPEVSCPRAKVLG